MKDVCPSKFIFGNSAVEFFQRKHSFPLQEAGRCDVSDCKLWVKNEVGESKMLPWKHKGQNILAVTSMLQILCTINVIASRLCQIQSKRLLGWAGYGICIVLSWEMDSQKENKFRFTSERLWVRWNWIL